MGWGQPAKLRARRTPLRRWRERTGSTLMELSRISGVPYRTLTRISGGAPAAGKTAVAISRHTSIPVAELVAGCS